MVFVAAVVDVHNEQRSEQKNEWTVSNLRLQELCSQLTDAGPVSSLGAHPAAALSLLLPHLEEDGRKRA